jgi:hypothetical protein
MSSDHKAKKAALFLASKLFLHTFFTIIVFELSYPVGLKEFPAAATLYLVNSFGLNQLESSLNLSFNFRIILRFPCGFQQGFGLFQALSPNNLRKALSVFPFPNCEGSIQTKI